MDVITERLLARISGLKGGFRGAFGVRENGVCAARASSANISVEPKKDKPGLDVRVAPGARGETVYVPACVTRGGVDDLAYNDFFVGEGADVVIEAGCGVHTDDRSAARHSGVHRFFIGRGARVEYREKHVGTGDGDGVRSIDPVTDVVLGEGAFMRMDTSQIGGVGKAVRKTTARVARGAKLVVRERLLTDGDQVADTSFDIELDGPGAGADVVSRSVARDRSRQTYVSTIAGNAPCTGHTECDAIIDGDATVDASPRLFARDKEASLIHEAAIGRIAGEQILKFRTLGLSEEEAEKKIIEGFLA